LEKYLLSEPEDEKILNNPKEVVLDNGGYIFFVKSGEEVVGTVSLIKVDENTFEIAKLAVTENHKKLGIGKMLMEKCLYVAKQKNANRIILYTNHILTSAIVLYKKFEFKETPLVNNKYMESDLKMELEL
ncbi:MAG: GNAT family N-acetyltransferase, partial [Clostridiaceae bacterium]|nr:GNAT family N-acetyltransferase [Clostridiaceae bacterium]